MCTCSGVCCGISNFPEVNDLNVSSTTVKMFTFGITERLANIQICGDSE